MENHSTILWSERPTWLPILTWLFVGLMTFPITIFGSLYFFGPDLGPNQGHLNAIVLMGGGSGLFIGLVCLMLSLWFHRKIKYTIYANGKVVCQLPFQEVSFVIRPTTKYSVSKSPIFGNGIAFETERRCSFSAIQDPDQVARILDSLIKSST